jgi:hypothetical protein
MVLVILAQTTEMVEQVVHMAEVEVEIRAVTKPEQVAVPVDRVLFVLYGLDAHEVSQVPV